MTEQNEQIEQTSQADHVEHPVSPDYAVKLSLTQIKIGVVIALGLVGSIFAAGIKVQNEISKIELSKAEQKYQQEITKLNLTLGREAMEAKENLTFYKDQYRVTKKRLDTCLAGGEFTDIFNKDSTK